MRPRRDRRATHRQEAAASVTPRASGRTHFLVMAQAQTDVVDLTELIDRLAPGEAEVDEVFQRVQRTMKARAMKRALLTEALDGHATRYLADAILELEAD